MRSADPYTDRGEGEEGKEGGGRREKKECYMQYYQQKYDISFTKMWIKNMFERVPSFDR